MSYQHLDVTTSGKVAIVTFDRPEKLNALSRDLMLEITDAANAFHEDVDTRAVVFTGKGKHFSAGVDMRDPDRGGEPGATRLRQRRTTRLGPEMIRAIFEINQITIAAINVPAYWRLARAAKIRFERVERFWTESRRSSATAPRTARPSDSMSAPCERTILSKSQVRILSRDSAAAVGSLV